MFSPYHTFGYCSRLRTSIDRLNTAGLVPHDILTDHNKYHYSLTHKLSSAKFHLENLKDVLNNTDPAIVVNSAEFTNVVNTHLDSFFYCCGSALDILAREVLTYYNIALPSRLHFHNARQLLNRYRAGNALINRLDNPNWKDEFSNYRNALTHELLIGTVYNIQINNTGPELQRVIKFPLPDNPRLNVNLRTYNRNQDAYLYCERTFIRIITLINTIYRELNTQIIATGRLPL